MNEQFLLDRLNKRKDQGIYRELKLLSPDFIDFTSNDYLGIVKNGLLEASPARRGAPGSTGSRLLRGNYSLIMEVEALLAQFHETEAALIFNSGYDANLSLLSCIPQRGDLILYDQLSHASIRDGVKLSQANSLSFEHNNLTDLERKLNSHKGRSFVITESVFSMDGDLCPLEDMVRICELYEAYLIIDEAHATGVLGARGEGLVQERNLSARVFARVHTFSKACGVHGAAIVGSINLKQYLINFARSFIYTTALPESSIKDIYESYRLFPGMNRERAHLRVLIDKFRGADQPFEKLESETPIQGVIIPGNDAVKLMAATLQKAGLDVRPIVYPTVPQGRERLRLVLHAFNSEKELDILLNCLKNSC